VVHFSPLHFFFVEHLYNQCLQLKLNLFPTEALNFGIAICKNHRNVQRPPAQFPQAVVLEDVPLWTRQ
jgi:hypothetical protein